MPSNESVAIIGGGTVGCEIAHLLVDRGCEVTVIEMLPDFCNGMEVMHKGLLLNALEEKATMRAGAQIQEVTETGVKYICRKGEEQFAPGNIVICATGQRPAGTDFVRGLAEVGIVPHRLGESISTPGNIRTATRSALDLAYSI